MCNSDFDRDDRGLSDGSRLIKGFYGSSCGIESRIAVTYKGVHVTHLAVGARVFRIQFYGLLVGGHGLIELLLGAEGIYQLDI